MLSCSREHIGARHNAVHRKSADNGTIFKKVGFVASGIFRYNRPRTHAREGNRKKGLFLQPLIRKGDLTPASATARPPLAYLRLVRARARQFLTLRHRPDPRAYDRTRAGDECRVNRSLPTMPHAPAPRMIKLM